MSCKHFIPGLVVTLLSFGVGYLRAQDDKQQENIDFSDAQLEHFETKIRPLLAKRCFECHGPDADEAGGGLRITSRGALLKGGDTGPAIVPGKPADSILIDAINYGEVYEMPPDSKMPAEEIALLTEWVKEKAPWPNVKDVHLAETNSFNIGERKKSHWAWTKPGQVSLPDVQDKSWPLDGFDHFILAENEKAGLKMAQPADRRTWIRRVYFDLIGLPPTPEQVQTFLNDESEKAHEKVVDELLASEHFGERWARHWMDLIRYAETCGHEFDYPIPHAHQYRSYLIRAFNSDVPYDQFIKEQIAGDLIPNPRLNPTEKFNESIMGTGFWHLDEATHAPVDVRLDEANHIDNRIDVISKSFLGLTVACARCHDHKFDAISTKDYYAFAGFMQSTRRQLAMLDPHGKIESETNKIRQIRESVAQQIRKNSAVSLGSKEQIKKALLTASGQQQPNPKGAAQIVEGESIQASGNTGGESRQQDMNPFGTQWSGNRQLYWIADKQNAELQFEIDVAESGEYNLEADITKAPDYGIFQLEFNGKAVGKPIDGYDGKVIHLSNISLGQIKLEKGKQQFSIKTVGTNPKASPKRFMVGIDLFRLVKVTKQSTAENILPKSDVAEATLIRWKKELEAAAQNDAHTLWLWQQVTRKGTTFDKGMLRNFQATIEKQKKLNASQELPYVFTDFSQPNFGNWFVTGEAFGNQPTQDGHWDTSQQGVGYFSAGMADSSRYSKKLHGVLRSPTFELNCNEIWYRIKAENVKIRLIIDGYVMDVYNGLLFGGISINANTKGQFQWIRQAGDMRRYKGHRAHLEIIDQGGGFAVVDKIVFSNGGRPDFVPASAEKILPLVASANNLEEFATLYAQAISELPRHGLAIAGGGDSFEKTVSDALQMIGTIERDIPNPLLAPAITDGTPEDEFVFVRGNHKALGPKVERRLLEAISGDQPIKGSDRSSGRLELANQMASADNPLTARVAVNRLWHHIFGRGIVASTDNFGVLGSLPSNQPLLDYLAREFVADGWSVKRMLKRMVLSQTYRMSSTLNPKAAEIDPDNIKLHRMSVRRLQAEAIRDAMLAISGRLDPKIGGPSVKLHLTPFMQGRGRPGGGNGPVDGNGRRSLYIEIRRNFLPPMLVAFDMPIPFNAIGRRNLSNVPAQALILMNDPFVVGQAAIWSKKLIESTPEMDQRIEQIYQQAFSRLPTAVEKQNALDFLEMQAKELNIKPAAIANSSEVWKDLCHVIMNVKEFIYLK